MPIHVFLGKKEQKKIYLLCVCARILMAGLEPALLIFLYWKFVNTFFPFVIVVHCTYTLAVKLLWLECFPYFPLFVFITYAHKTHALPTELCCFLRNLLLEADFLNGITRYYILTHEWSTFTANPGSQKTTKRIVVPVDITRNRNFWYKYKNPVFVFDSKNQHRRNSSIA